MIWTQPHLVQQRVTVEHKDSDLFRPKAETDSRFDIEFPLLRMDRDGHGVGLRAEYLNAVSANLLAKRQYDEVRTQLDQRVERLQSDDSRASRPSPSVLLSQRIELVRLQKQHARLTILKDELETIRESRELVALDVRSAAAKESIVTRPNTGNELTVLADSITRSLKALELAVVRARDESQRQKRLLERAKAMYGDLTTSSSPQQRIHAMTATRKELTAWLEESLDRCQGENSEPDQREDGAGEFHSATSERQIDAQYEQYLEARKRLLSAVSCLQAPLQDPNPPDYIEPANASLPRSQPPKDHSVLNAIEKRLLPVLEQQRLSENHLTFTNEQLEQELASTISMLDRLSDESQLLQAFPILARSGRFANAAATFGKQHAAAEDEEKVKDEVSKRIEPWIFASSAADVSSAETMEKSVNRGMKAMDSVARSLSELRLLRDTRS